MLCLGDVNLLFDQARKRFERLLQVNRSLLTTGFYICQFYAGLVLTGGRLIDYQTEAVIIRCCTYICQFFQVWKGCVMFLICVVLFINRSRLSNGDVICFVVCFYICQFL